MEAKLRWGIKHSRLVEIDDVQSGADCGCICPSCRDPLVAKKGTLRIHHFAHSTNLSCTAGHESAIHLLAKDTIAKAGQLIIPEVRISFRSGRHDIVAAKPKLIEFDEIELEKSHEDFRPDLTCWKKEVPLFVEIKVTHEVDELKRGKIERSKVSCVEIDLSEKDWNTPRSVLEDAILNNPTNRHWIFNSYSANILDSFRSIGVWRTSVFSGPFGRHIEDCPLASQGGRVKTCARAWEECHECPYDYQFEHDRTTTRILCGGHARVSTLRELKAYQTQSGSHA